MSTGEELLKLETVAAEATNWAFVAQLGAMRLAAERLAVEQPTMGQLLRSAAPLAGRRAFAFMRELLHVTEHPDPYRVINDCLRDEGFVLAVSALTARLETNSAQRRKADVLSWRLSSAQLGDEARTPLAAACHLRPANRWRVQRNATVHIYRATDSTRASGAPRPQYALVPHDAVETMDRGVAAELQNAAREPRLLLAVPMVFDSEMQLMHVAVHLHGCPVQLETSSSSHRVATRFISTFGDRLQCGGEGGEAPAALRRSPIGPLTTTEAAVALAFALRLAPAHLDKADGIGRLMALDTAAVAGTAEAAKLFSGSINRTLVSNSMALVAMRSAYGPLCVKRGEPGAWDSLVPNFA